MSPLSQTTFAQDTPPAMQQMDQAKQALNLLLEHSAQQLQAVYQSVAYPTSLLDSYTPPPESLPTFAFPSQYSQSEANSMNQYSHSALRSMAGLANRVPGYDDYVYDEHGFINYPEGESALVDDEGDFYGKEAEFVAYHEEESAPIDNDYVDDEHGFVNYPEGESALVDDEGDFYGKETEFVAYPEEEEESELYPGQGEIFEPQSPPPFSPPFPPLTYQPVSPPASTSPSTPTPNPLDHPNLARQKAALDKLIYAEGLKSHEYRTQILEGAQTIQNLREEIGHAASLLENEHKLAGDYRGQALVYLRRAKEGEKKARVKERERRRLEKLSTRQRNILSVNHETMRRLRHRLQGAEEYIGRINEWREIHHRNIGIAQGLKEELEAEKKKVLERDEQINTLRGTAEGEEKLSKHWMDKYYGLIRKSHPVNRALREDLAVEKKKVGELEAEIQALKEGLSGSEKAKESRKRGREDEDTEVENEERVAKKVRSG